MLAATAARPTSANLEATTFGESLHRVDTYGDDGELFGQVKMRRRPLADNRCLMAFDFGRQRDCATSTPTRPLTGRKLDPPTTVSADCGGRFFAS
jgi:hypothetical protein